MNTKDAADAAKNFEADLLQVIENQNFSHNTDLQKRIESLQAQLAALKSELHNSKIDDLSDVEYLRNLADSCRLDLSKEPPTPQFLVNFCEHKVLSAGGISALVGAKKSRKTTAAVAICAAFLTKKEFLKFEGAGAACGRVLWFDTEQSNYHFLKALSALLSLSNLPRNTDKIVAYSIRSKSFEERFAIIDFVLSQDAQTNDLVIIDGIVDLSADPVLKRDEATTIVSMLMKHAENKQIHILSVLHENSSNERGRGHIYAEIANKCEAVFSVKKESDKPLADSTIELIVSRNYAEGKVTFNIENGVPKAVEATEHTVTYSIYAFADAVKEIFKREKTEWITAGRLQTLIVDYKRAKQTATKLPRNKNEILEALARLLDAGVLTDNEKSTVGRAYKWVKDLPGYAANNLNV